MEFRRVRDYEPEPRSVRLAASLAGRLPNLLFVRCPGAGCGEEYFADRDRVRLLLAGPAAREEHIRQAQEAAVGELRRQCPRHPRSFLAP